MKKNTRTYVLLTVVALIWGTIGYKIISSLSSDPETGAQELAVSFKPLPVQKKETFAITADYRDPFLGTLPKKKKKKRLVSTKPKAPAVPEVSIRYTGLMTDGSTNQKIFFVTIDGQQHLMNAKDEIAKVTLISGSAASIRIRHNNKTRTIQRTE